jgi:uncharacterized membrane protein
MLYQHNMSTGGWALSILATLIIVALLVAAIAWIAFELRDRRRGASTTAPPAGEILDRRLATGEITIEQFQQLHEALADPSSPLSSRSGLGASPTD